MTKMVVGSTSAFSTIKPLVIKCMQQWSICYMDCAYFQNILDGGLLLTKTLLKQQCNVIRLCHHLQNVAAAIMTWL